MVVLRWFVGLPAWLKTKVKASLLLVVEHRARLWKEGFYPLFMILAFISGWGLGTIGGAKTDTSTSDWMLAILFLSLPMMIVVVYLGIYRQENKRWPPIRGKLSVPYGPEDVGYVIATCLGFMIGVLG